MIKSTPKSKIYLRPPVAYWGGKTLMLPTILPLIPPHRKYNEPFVGGGAVYWAKQPSDMETINDADGFVTNFYKVLKTEYTPLCELINGHLYSRKSHDEALVMRQFPNLFSDIQRAWAFYFLTNTSLFGILDNAQNTPSTDNKPVKTFFNKVNRFDTPYLERLKNTYVENRDALYVITKQDSPDTFHYIDPPYFNSDCGHYAGYSEADFRRLLDLLTTLKGKFLMSCYPNTALDEYATKNGWIVERKEMTLNAGAKGKKKIECLTRNYIL